METIVFDPAEDIGNARQDPDFFLQNHPPPLFLDEIQYAPELLSAIKRRVDREKKKGMYILSGSQNFSVLKSISESLAGRVFVQELFPMSLRERNKNLSETSFLKSWLESKGSLDLKEIRNLFKNSTPPSDTLIANVWKGGYPALLHLPDNLLGGYWRSYFQTYIERDIRSMSNIGNLHTFGKFFALLSALTAQEVNATELGRELGIDRKTAIHWKEIAIASYQWLEIPSFGRNPIKKLSGKSKGYFTDPGFITYFQGIPTPQILETHPFLGRMVETYMVMEILKIISDLDYRPNLYHFRNRSGSEVDLILEYGGVYFPFEIKTKSHINGNDCRGITTFRKLFPNESIAPGIVLSAIESPEKITETSIAIPYWIL